MIRRTAVSTTLIYVLCGVVVFLWRERSLAAEYDDRLEHGQRLLSRARPELSRSIFRALARDFGSRDDLDRRIRAAQTLVEVTKHLNERRPAEALRILESIPESELSDAVTWWYLSQVHGLLGHLELAAEALRRAREMDPTEPWAGAKETR